jgi:Protein of unknown function (DUF3149)
MTALKLLVTTDAGLASLAIIVFMVAMGGYLLMHVKKLMKQKPGKQGWD